MNAYEVTTQTSADRGLIMFIWLAVAVLMIASLWKIFAKAGQPGGGALIPIYNAILLIQIAGKPVWWIMLMFIPVVNFVISILMTVELAKSFRKGGGFATGLIFFLSAIFCPILAFGSATYQSQPSAAA